MATPRLLARRLCDTSMHAQALFAARRTCACPEMHLRVACRVDWSRAVVPACSTLSLWHLRVAPVTSSASDGLWMTASGKGTLKGAQDQCWVIGTNVTRIEQIRFYLSNYHQCYPIHADDPTLPRTSSDCVLTMDRVHPTVSPIHLCGECSCGECCHL